MTTQAPGRRTAVIGITTLRKDAAAAIMVDGVLCSAAEEERFSRRRHDSTIPWRSLRACLQVSDLSMSDIDCVAVADDPSLRIDWELWMAGKETRPVIAAELVRRLDYAGSIRAIREALGFDCSVRFVPRHNALAGSAICFARDKDAGLVVIDGSGEWSTCSIGTVSSQDRTHIVEQDRSPDSLALFYNAITGYLGFDVNTDGEFETAILSGRGNPSLDGVLREAIDCGAGGAVSINPEYFDFAAFVLGSARTWSDRFMELLGRPPRNRDDPIEPWHIDLASSAQRLVEECVLQKIRMVRARTPATTLLAVGDLFLNASLAGRLKNCGLFDDVVLQPGPSGASAALGAAVSVTSEFGLVPQRINHLFLGPGFSPEHDVLPLLDRIGVPYVNHLGSFDGLVEDVAGRLASQDVVGWFGGRMEFGQRMIGNRAIVADPRPPHMAARVRKTLKARSSVPSAVAVVLEQDFCDYFDSDQSPPPRFVESVRVVSDSIPALVRPDGSAPVQVVDPIANPRLATLLAAFKRKTGCAVLLMAPLGQHGEPTACSVLDALSCFARMRLDALALSDVLVDRNALPQTWRARMLTQSFIPHGRD